ncbi:MAG TPA: 50S ribosomal protein L23 [Phycisphaerae bacterium]|jgi:large subunit ribosomal protein L23|nr:50S ribosomal protein L23 [Phycisphaerae bacterium]HOB75745.1 50S ribosomal protein L23 [Phycisphaerae bacterium]HOJ55623.1 50S ribosomal protein L23 [Phycisphaerae bacterium]HOL27681.1 50S ribosomal protein L23 [Phycisphaerae bacterium]HPP21937.1 50S ribosomal protein L23 [Phycisphaerae bacterium]
MDIYHTIIRPLVTEKGTHQSQKSHEQTATRPARGGAYAFQVHPKANKTQIRHAVEKIYNVRVQSVRTATRHGKRRRYRMSIGRTSDWKKAVVVLHPDYHIDLF